MIPMLTDQIAQCAVCGDVASNEDLLYVEDADEADAMDLAVHDIVCRDCAQ